MAKPNTRIESINQNLLEYLGGEGLSLTPTRRAEILARLEGHANVQAKALYARQCERFLVFALDLGDVVAADIFRTNPLRLEKTLAMNPYSDDSDQAAAKLFAEQQAALHDKPFVVVNGAFEVMHIVEAPLSNHEDYSIWAPVGVVSNPNPTTLVEPVAEDLDLVDAGILKAHVAVAMAMDYIAKQTAAGIPVPHLFVTRGTERKVIWKA